MFKYLFSISTFKTGKSVDSMCIFCGKDSEDSSEDLCDFANNMNIQIVPMTNLITVTGNDVDNDKELMQYIEKIEKLVTKIN